MNREELISLIAKRVEERLHTLEDYKIPIGVSNRHIHLNREDMDVLFGEGYELSKKSDLKQPGQFAANETVMIRGPKGEFEHVRILGPLRSRSQVEISIADSFRLGVKAPIKESGNIKGTPGLELIGPKGRLQISQGTIVALRHIHMTYAQARKMGVHDRQFVDVQVYGQRKIRMSNVLIRVSDAFCLEMHVDTDEANAAGIKNNDFAILMV